MWLLMLLLADSVSAQDWSVLAVRVSFPREVPDDPTTTGDGRFDLRSPEEARGEYRLPFDLPPHDRKYFRAHLRALGHYWHTASGGKLRINFEVYPEEDTASYRMPRPLIWYGSGRGDEASKRLVQLFRDAVTALDSAEDVDFSKFRIVVVFHAGVGRETGEYNDISSAYLTPDDFERYGPVVAGGDTLWEGIILPEALRPDGIGGLNGLMAKVFGYALGLPELSNTGDGLPALGGWSLMDVGWLNPTEIEGRLGWGFVPCLPSAWELMHLGWLEPLEVVRDTTVWVAAAHLSEVPEDAVRALKVPVGPKEYFLIENRKAHYRQAELSERNQVWLWVDSYDASVPGSGVLIWHVDEGVISERPNDPNDDPLSRGIDLEEADGDEAIGNPNREGNMWGGPGDPFYLGGNSRFGPDTTPSSRSNRGWDTGIEIEVLDPPRDLMRVQVSFRRNFPRWPKDVIEDLSHSAPLPTTYELLILGRDRLYMLGLRNMSLPLPVVPFGIPAAGDIDDDGLLEVAFVDSSGVLWWPAKGRWDSASVGFRPTSGPVVADMLPEEGIEVAVGGDGEVALLRPGEGVVLREELEGRVSGMAFGRDVGLLCLTEEGGVFSVRGGRVRRLWTGGLGWSSGPVIGDIDGDRGVEVAAASGGWLTALKVRSDTVLVLSGFPVMLDGPIRGLCLGDIDGDGGLELVATGEKGVYAWHGSGALTEGFPVGPPQWDRAGELSLPVLADVDGDGVADVLFSAEGVGVYAFTGEGKPVPAFPLPASEGRLSAPFVSDIDRDGWVEVGVVSGNRVHLWRTVGLPKGADWPVVGGDINRVGYHLSRGAILGRGEALLAGAYIYPNPTDGTATLRFNLGRYARVKVWVLDGTGGIVRKEREEEMERGVREVPLNLSGLPPGLYLVRIEARSGGDVGVNFLKAAVLR